MLYTRKGDDGTSGLFGTRDRFPKDSLTYEALGSLDELNSLLGICSALAQEDASETRELVRTAQQHLFIAQAEVAGAAQSLDQAHIDWLEGSIATVEATIENPHSFVLPGATLHSAFLDFARAVCRRAERALVRAQSERDVSGSTRAYLNRLSSLLYALARSANARAGASETPPTYA